MVLHPLSQSRSQVWNLLITGVALVFLTNLGFAQNLKDFVDPLGLKPVRDAEPATPKAKVTFNVQPKTAKPGDTVTFTIKVDLAEGSHTYSMSPKFGGGTKVVDLQEDGLNATDDFTADREPKSHFDKLLDAQLEEFEGSVTWTRKYRILPDATTAKISGLLDFQVCDKSCLPMKEPFSIEIPLVGRKASSGAKQFEIVPKLKTDRVQAVLSLGPKDAKAGDLVSVQLHLKIDPGWHVFSTTQSDEEGADPTSFEVTTHDGLEVVDEDFSADRPYSPYEPPKSGETGADGKPATFHQQIYEKEVTWTRKFKLAAGKELSDVSVAGEIFFQVCERVCIRNKFQFVLPASQTTSSTDVVQSRGNANPPAPTAVKNESPEPRSSATTGEATSNANSSIVDLSGSDCVNESASSDPRSQGLLYVVGAAFLAGLLALLTPCVFPMVPITVSFFLKQSEKKHSSPLALAIVYCLSIIGTFTVLGLVVSGLFGATSITKLANGVAINLFLGVVLIFFSLNLLGLFDIQVPSWLLTFTASKESASSYFGVFFMALTFTLTSFTCTFAFLGLILVWAANGEFWWPLAGLLSFSTAFAFPFFLLALFPSYLQKLPKSGGWMNRVKVVMGLIELAFMFKFLSVADVAWNSTPTLLDYHLVMSAWMAISIVAGLYLIGKIQLPHDTKEDHVGVIPMVTAMGFFCLAGYLGVGIFAQEPPGGFLGQKIQAFAPPRLQGGSDADGPYLIGKHDQKKYLLDLEHAMAKAKRENLPLFVDFTGVNCTNCREMEVLMSRSGLKDKLDRFVRVQLYTDKMPKEAVGDPKKAKALIDRNEALQSGWMKDASLPGYAIASSDGSVIYSKIVGTATEPVFATFLDCGHKKWQENAKTTQVASTKH